MTRSTLVFKNLLRNKLRTSLTIMAVALPLFVYTAAQVVVDATDQLLAELDKNMRVAVHGKLTFVEPLPQRLRDDIEEIAPAGYIEAVCRASWFGGKLKDSQTTFFSMGVDHDTFHLVYPDYGIEEADIEAFQKDRRSTIVSASLAKTMNWAVGDKVTLAGGIPPFPEMEFIVAAVVEKLTGPRMYLRLDYYDEVWQQEAGQPRGVNNFWIRCSSPQGREWALTAIDDHFANSEHETQTEMESTFIATFFQSGGDWVGMMGTIGKLVVLVALAVAFNTMSMAFRERTSEFAVLRALGYQPGGIIGMVISEGLLLGVIGGGLAVGAAALLIIAGGALMASFSVSVSLQPETLYTAFGVAVACGLLASIIPATMAGRLQVSAALRKVV